MAVVFMTAFYSFRAIFLTFHGEYKGGEPPEHGAHDAHAGQPHESPLVMTLPLLILAVPAVLAGFANFPNHSTEGIAHLLEGALPESSAQALHKEGFNFGLAAASTVLALAGIGLAYVVYQAKAISAESLQRAFGPIHRLVSRKYYMDELYEDGVVRRGLYGTVCAAAQWFDTNIVDGAVNGAGALTRRVGDGLRWVQSGSVQAYGSVGFAGLVLTAFLMLVLLER